MRTRIERLGTVDYFIHCLIARHKIGYLPDLLALELCFQTLAFYWQRLVHSVNVMARLLDALAHHRLLGLSVSKRWSSPGQSSSPSLGAANSLCVEGLRPIRSCLRRSFRVETQFIPSLCEQGLLETRFI